MDIFLICILCMIGKLMLSRGSGIVCMICTRLLSCIASHRERAREGGTERGREEETERDIDPHHTLQSAANQIRLYVGLILS